MVAEIIAKLEAFVAHPVVDSMTPVWSLSQDDAREILHALTMREAAAKRVDLAHFGSDLAELGSFREIRQAVGTKIITFP
jgi:hypothetical protein